VGAQTTLKVTNRTGTDIRVYLTLGRADGCVQDVKAISFVTDPVNPQQGWFILGKGATKTYTPPQGQGISGNFAFGSPPLNCPTTEYPNGINLAEFMLNNNFQGPGAQETIDISCVAGANALIAFAMTAGGGWNGGNSQPNVAQFASKALGQNTGPVGITNACDYLQRVLAWGQAQQVVLYIHNMFDDQYGVDTSSPFNYHFGFIDAAGKPKGILF